MKQHLLRLPGLLSWTVLLVPLFLVSGAPTVAAVFFLMFSLFWLYRSIQFAYYLVKSYIKFRLFQQLEWKSALAGESFKAEASIQKDLETYRLSTEGNTSLHAEDLTHIVIVATYKEPFEVLKETIESLKLSSFNLKQILVVLATEERDEIEGYRNGIRLRSLYLDTFQDFIITSHPKDIPGEVSGKGGNITHAARIVTDSLRRDGKLQEETDAERYIVTTLDADNKVHEDYFSVLSYMYLKSPNRLHHSYQPLPFLCNNLWNVPIFVRIVAISATFWHFIESGRSDRLRNFSSHAQPLASLMAMDFWSTSTIVEDGHQFWRSYVHYKGHYNVVPLYIPIYQDAVQSEDYVATLIAQYKQLRRWAHGAEDIAFMINAMGNESRPLPKRKTLDAFLGLVEGHLMWATAPLILTITTLSFHLTNPTFTSSTVFYNFGYLLSLYFTVALVGIAISIGMSFLLLPLPDDKERTKSWYFRASLVFQWFLLPITTILFAAVPALDAQTRMLFGKVMTFNVTKKVRQGA